MAHTTFGISDPGVDKDFDAGFRRGSRFINKIKGREFICIDPANGAAVWEADSEHHFESKMDFTGRDVWRDAGRGNYWAVASGNFYLLRGGEGFINGERIIWEMGQDVALTTKECNFIYIDADGVIQVATAWTHELMTDNIVLFEVWYVSDSEFIVCREDHPVSVPAHTSVELHTTIGNVFEFNGEGGTVTREATGTGAAAADRKIKMVGEGEWSDHGLDTTIPDSGGSGVSWHQCYTDGSGDWRRDAEQTELVMKWNDAGTPTALGAGKFGVFRLGCTKSSLNSDTPEYIAVMDNAEHANLNAARNAIAAGVVIWTAELDLLEIVQLGYAIVKNSGGGYIIELTVAKSVLAGGIVSGGATNQAALVQLITTLFDGILSAADGNVQSAMETLDDHTHASGGYFDAYAKLFEVQAANSAGGTFTQGAWQTRVLNAEADDPEGIVTFAANQFTLAAGTYLIKASAPAFAVDRHKVRLQNITDAATELIGTSEIAAKATAVETRSFVEGLVTIADTKAFEIQHYCAATQAANGFGVESNFAVAEVYTVVEIWRLA